MATTKMFFTATLLFISLSLVPASEVITTIVIIQGEPQLVDISAEGEVISTYGKVPAYFSSSAQHDDIVKRSMDNYKEKSIKTDYVKFVRFNYGETIIDEDLVNYVRQMAVAMESDQHSQMLMTLNVQSDYDSVKSRADAIKDLLTSFGVEAKRIKQRKRKYRGSQPNQFIKLELQPSL